MLKTKLPGTVLLVFLLCVACREVRAASITLADFEDGVSDFSGAIVHDGAVAHDGRASGRMDADFSKPGDAWITAERTLDIKNQLKTVRFWVKSSDFSGITVRLVDSTGQTHQQRPAFEPNGQWQQITIDTFDGGKGYEKWGGANDGKFHWPAVSLALIAEKGPLNGKLKGTLWVDSIEAEVVGELPKPEPITQQMIGDFETNTDGFTGAIARIDTDAKTGHACGKIEADFSHGGDPWVTASKQLDVQNQLKAVSFYVKSTDAHGLTVRLVDSTGQTHQQRPTFTADGQWQKITIRSFDHGVGYEKWGGANDGKFHWPAASIAFILEKQNIDGKDKGSLLLDDVELSLVGAPKGALDDAQSVSVATFETGTDGFKGAIARDDTQAKTGKASGRIDADFSHGGDAWVTASHDLSVKSEIKAVRFWIKSSDSHGLTVRLVDSTGQNHQQRPTFAADGEWHQITLAKLTGGPGYEHWGGAADGQFHQPASSISFILEKPSMIGKDKGSVWIDDVELLVDPNPIVPAAEVMQKQLGNVFCTNEIAEIDLHTQADQVKWTVTDFWHNTVDQGNAPVADHYAVIQPAKNLRGWFALHMQAMKDGTDLAHAETTFAILTPVDLTKMENSPFGVMTHFAQDWDTDIMPLIAKAGIGTIRDELYWAQVEQKPGVYVFREQFEKYMAEAARLHIDPLIVMSFSNPLYDGGKTPFTPEGCDAYGRYGQAILQHFGKQIKWLEIWNEYNGTWCVGPAAQERPRYYAQMLEHASAKIKEIRPDVKVIGGASVLQPLPYFEGIFKYGGLANMDGAGIHPYRENPEGVEQDVADLQGLMAQYGTAKPAWATETGRSDFTPDGRDHVAKYLVRQYTLLLSAHVEKICWYLCRDYDVFNTMGLLRDPKDPLGKYVPAPAYVAYGNLIRQLYCATFQRHETTDPHTFIEQFTKDGDPVRVCWATEPAHVAFKVDQPVVLVDMMGTEQTLSPVNGEVYLTLDDAPVFLKGPASPIDHGRFEMAASQTTDISDKLRVRYSYNNAGSDQPVQGVLSIRGVSYPFACKPNEMLNGEAVLSDQNTAANASQAIRYEWSANGKTAGKGAVTVEVIDPLAVERQPVLASGNCVELVIANRADNISSHTNSIEWNFAGRVKSQLLSIALAPKSQAIMSLPVTGVEPFKEYPIAATLKLDGRDPVMVQGTVSDNPCVSRSKIEQWKDVPSIDGNGHAWIAWDATNFYLTAKVKAGEIHFGIAPADAANLRDGWYEFTASTDGLKCTLAPTAEQLGSDVPLKTQLDGDETVFEIAIPWARLSPIVPADGQFRLAVSAGNEIHFGDGLNRGRTPALYRLCRIVGTDAAASAATEASATIQPIKLDSIHSEPGKVVADSVQDYSNTQGRNNWSYGYYAGDGAGMGNGIAPTGPYTGNDFRPMNFVETTWGYEWSDSSADAYMKLSPNGGHPGQQHGKPLWAVRRWTSTVDGSIKITGHLNRADTRGDGVDGKVLVDGVVVWTGASGGPGRPKSADCDVTTQVKKGSLVDFAITPGPAADTNYDSTEFTVRIQSMLSR